MHDQILIPNGFLSDNSLHSGCFFGGGVKRDRAAIELPPPPKKRTTTENKKKTAATQANQKVTKIRLDRVPYLDLRFAISELASISS